ncbi:MAG: hypothetical protein KAX49_01280 [Halanaerobiales bacterium]|nr:hypothetical protein [Halanaerobiales bacterium]
MQQKKKLKKIILEESEIFYDSTEKATNQVSSNQEQSANKYSFEEFKLIYESTELVTNRRLANNKWNYSICVGIIFVIFNIWKWANGNNQYSYVAYTLIIMLSLIAILFCVFWVKQITDFKLLNNAKFVVLNEIASNIAFTSQIVGVNIISSEPFKKEWEILNNIKGLQNVKNRDIVALQSSNMEYFIPKAFIVIFIVICFVLIIIISTNFQAFLNGWLDVFRNSPV